MPPGETLRQMGIDRDRLPLSAGVLQMESGRAPLVQSDQCQLGWQTTPNPGDNAGLYTRNQNEDWIDCHGATTGGQIRHRTKGEESRNGSTCAAEPHEPSKVEL